MSGPGSGVRVRPSNERDGRRVVIADGEPVARGAEGEAIGLCAIRGLGRRHALECRIIEAQGAVKARRRQPPVGSEGRAVTGVAIRLIARHLAPAGVAVIDAQAIRPPQHRRQVPARGREDQVEDDVGQTCEALHEGPGVAVEEVDGVAGPLPRYTRPPP